MNKSNFGALFFLSSPPLQFLTTETYIYIYMAIYAACGTLMTAPLRCPSELEVENNDCRAEDVIQKVKERSLQGFCMGVKCHPV